MNIKNLKEGQVVKNYKELCLLIEEENLAGNSKKSQLKEFERFIKYHKEGNKFVIEEIYEEPLEKIDNRGNKNGEKSNSYKKYNNLKITSEEDNNYGVYYILKDNDIYIGSTIQGFRKRFQEHKNGYDKLMNHTYELLQNGGEFHILYDMTGLEDETLVRMVENEYIQYFRNYTNYNVINHLKGSYSEKIKYKRIKVLESNYEKAMQLLINNGLIEVEDKETGNNEEDLEFDYSNIQF